ncbi:IS6 family transposase [Neokomagataea thailandica]|uniref:IS6 family transposase n=1 Tax=Neokomagataea TaxID=1223423 RepID=UPI000B2494A5|nr:MULTISPECIES: IS6 family transposase [Neokomagataea]
MSDFKGRHFRGEVILWAVRWYCRYGISYRDLETMLAERGVSVDHSTIYRWVQRYAPEMEKRLRWYLKRPGFSSSWRVDETYIKVKGKWAGSVAKLTFWLISCRYKNPNTHKISVLFISESTLKRQF